MNQHNQQSDANQDWDDCPAGEIQGFSQGLRAKKQQQQLQQISLIGGALAVLLAVGLWFGPDLNTQRVPQIACSDVKMHLPEYIEKTLKPAEMAQIKKHLDHCPECHDEYKAKLPTQIQAPPTQVFIESSPHTDLAAKVRNIDWSRSVAVR